MEPSRRGAAHDVPRWSSDPFAQRPALGSPTREAWEDEFLQGGLLWAHGEGFWPKDLDMVGIALGLSPDPLKNAGAAYA